MATVGATRQNLLDWAVLLSQGASFIGPEDYVVVDGDFFTWDGSAFVPVSDYQGDPNGVWPLTSAQVAGLNAGNLVDAAGGVQALIEVIGEVLADPSATTQILTGTGEYFAYRCTVAAGDITIYDNTASSGKLLVPTKALVLGTYPIFGAGVSKTLQVSNGIRVVLSGAATVYISRMVY